MIHERQGESILGFGIVGCGTIAATHADALAALDRARLVACCDLDRQAAQRFAVRHHLAPRQVYTDLDAFLNDPNVHAVSVCTPSGSHAKIAIQCLRVGRPVIVEKPMDVTREACDFLLAAQREANLPLGVISQHRFDPASVTTHNLVTQGALGDLILAEAQIKWFRTQEYYDSGDWRGTWALDGGGALMNQGVHTVDLLRWLAGPVTSVYAVARTAAHRRIEVEDIVCATLTFANGAIGNLAASTAAYPGFPATLSLHGTKGSIEISGDALHSVDLIDSEFLTPATVEDSMQHALDIARGGTRSAQAALPETGAVSVWGDAHRAQLADFIAAIRGNRAPLVDGIAAKQALEVIWAVYESARTGKVVTI